MLAIIIGVMCWFGANSVWAANALKTQVEVSSGSEQVVIFFDRPVTPVDQFALQKPRRFVVDLHAIESGRGVGLSPDYSGRLLRDIRYGKPEPGISRIVLDLNASVPPPTVTVGKSPPRLGITLDYDGPSQVGAATPVPAAKPKQQARHALKPLIVIDPGHGGKDSGAIGASGIKEKHITLRYAKKLRDALRSSGRYRVKLTRTDNRYLLLQERVNVARKHNADMFISLHADSNPNRTARGFSVYTLSEEASDAETAALAAQENRADVIGGIDLAVEDKEVATILLDLAQRETRNKGSEFAELIIANMDPKVPLLSNTHRFAGFRVLKAPDIPSVLVEVGFLSNRDDERRLQSREYQDKVTRSLLDAIDAYWRGRKRTNTSVGAWQTGYRITLLNDQSVIWDRTWVDAKGRAIELNPYLIHYLSSGHYASYSDVMMEVEGYQIPPETVVSLATRPVGIDQEGINYMINIIFTTQLQDALDQEWNATIKEFMLHHTKAFKSFYKGRNLNDLFNTYYQDWPDEEPGTLGEKFHDYVHADEYNWAHMDNFLLRGGPNLEFEDLGPFAFDTMPPAKFVVEINKRAELREQGIDPDTLVTNLKEMPENNEAMPEQPNQTVPAPPHEAEAKTRSVFEKLFDILGW